jgi:integrase
MQPMLGSKRLAEITPFDLECYRRQRKQAGVGDVSINRELAFLRNLCTMAIAWSKASENPVKKVRFARENNGRTRFLTREEEVRILTCCIPSLKPLVVTALHTGFRMSELLSLTWRDVAFHRRVIAVRAAYAKNGESRSIPMNSVLLEMLWSMQGDTLGNAPVFCTSRGTPHRDFRTTFTRVVRKAGIEDFRFHDLRHCFASRLVMAGVDLPTVQALIGHKNITITMRYASVRRSQAASGGYAGAFY